MCVQVAYQVTLSFFPNDGEVLVDQVVRRQVQQFLHEVFLRQKRSSLWIDLFNGHLLTLTGQTQIYVTEVGSNDAKEEVRVIA